MKACNFLKMTFGKVAVVGAMLSPLALTGCEGFGDFGTTAGYAGVDVGSAALGTPYYGNSCFSSNLDYYCDTGWSGWNNFGFGSGGPIASCPVDSGCDIEPSCQSEPIPAQDCGVQTEYFGRRVRLANARVIAGGLRLKYHISSGAARRLGYAFAAARKNNPRPLMAMGFTSADLAALKQHRPLSSQSVITISRNAGVSPRVTRHIIMDLERSYIRHASR